MKETEFRIRSDSWKEVEQLLEAGRANDALGILRAEVGGTSDSFQLAIAYEKVGAAMRWLNDHEAAIAAFERAISLHGSRNAPVLTRLYLHLGLSYKASGNISKALQVYEEGVNKLFDRAIRIITEGEQEYMFETEDDGKRVLNISPDALGKIKDLCRLDVTFAALRNNMGTCFWELGDTGAAREMFRESIEFTPAEQAYDHPIRNLERMQGL